MPGWFNTYKFVQNANASTAKAAAAPPRSSVFEYRPASNYLLGGNSTPSSPSSAYAANQQAVDVSPGLPKYQPGYWSSFLDKLVPTSNGVSSSAAAPGGTGVGGDYIGNGTTINYLNADLAKAYGMDASTAYQEALSNTGYQRSVKDMQAAGLNPAVLFGAGNGSAAGGVGYVSRAGNSYSSGASSAKSNHFFYKLLGNVGTIAAPAITKNPTSAFSGRAIMSSIGNLIDSALGT